MWLALLGVKKKNRYALILKELTIIEMKKYEKEWKYANISVAKKIWFSGKNKMYEIRMLIKVLRKSQYNFEYFQKFAKNRISDIFECSLRRMVVCIFFFR